MGKLYWKSGLTGGDAGNQTGDLDGIDGADVSANDFCFVNDGRSVMYYVANTNSAAEDAPWVIVPDVNPGTINWDLLTMQYAPIGTLVRPVFSYNAAAIVDLGAGGYHLDGIGWVCWESTLNYTLTSLAADTWSYVYIDHSDIVTADKTILTNAEFVDATTEPTFSATKGGWYNGSDRCILAVLGDGAGDLSEFWHDGGRTIHFASSITESLTAPTTSWVTYSALTAPAFCRSVILHVMMESASLDIAVHYRVTGSSSAGVRLVFCDQLEKDTATMECVVSSGQQVDFKRSAGTVSEFILINNGWLFGVGM